MGEDSNLISKKDLLERYSISYGALYRWKRKGLIPDEWFIKTATVTGQETFFPKDLVCERVERILGTRNELLLDELCEQLSGEKQNEKYLVIDTGYGEKSFPLRDIRSVSLVSGSGERKEYTDELMHLFEAQEKNM